MPRTAKPLGRRRKQTKENVPKILADQKNPFRGKRTPPAPLPPLALYKRKQHVNLETQTENKINGGENKDERTGQKKEKREEENRAYK